MKRTKKILLGFIFMALSVGMMTGCTADKERMDDNDATVLTEDQVDVSVIGSWDIAGKDRILEFKEDGTYDDKFSSGRTGTYSYMSQNVSFTISKLFDKVGYILCTDESGEKVLNGAILGDLISSYSLLDHKELYYLRVGRAPVAQEDILGSWRCIDRPAYTLTLNADGTGESTGDPAVYTMTQDDNYGTGFSLTATHDGKDNTTEYAVYKYEKYLFLSEVGTYKTYQLEPYDPSTEK